MDQAVYIHDVDNWVPANPEESKSEDEEIFYDLNLHSGKGSTYKHSITTLSDLQRVELVNDWVWCMADANVGAYLPEQRRGLRGQRMDQREGNKFILCAVCKRKTVFKHDGTAINPAQYIVEAKPNVYKTKRRRVLRGEALKQRQIIKFTLLSFVHAQNCIC